MVNMIKKETATKSSYRQFSVVLVFKTLVSFLWEKNGGVVAALNERENLARSIVSFCQEQRNSKNKFLAENLKG